MSGHQKVILLPGRRLRRSYSNSGNTKDLLSGIESIPGQDTDKGLIILANGGVRRVIKCDGINLYLLSKTERDKLGEQLSTLVNSLKVPIQLLAVCHRSLPEVSLDQNQRTNIEFLRWYGKYLTKWLECIREINYVHQRDFYIVLAVDPKVISGSTASTGDRQQLKQHIKTLDSQCEIALEHLHLAQLHPKLLRRNELRTLLHQQLYLRLASQAESINPPEAVTASTLIPPAVVRENESILIDSRCTGSILLAELPRETWTGWLAHLLPSNFPVTLSIHIEPDSQAMTRQDIPPAAKFNDRSKDERKFLEKLLREGYKAAEISICISTHATNQTTLQEQLKQLSALIRSVGGLAEDPGQDQLAVWKSTLAIGVNRIQRRHRVFSSIAGTCFPFISAKCGDRQGVHLGFATQTREEVLLSPFASSDSKRGRTILIDGPRSTADYIMTLLALRLLPTGVRLALVTDSGSSRFLADLLGPNLSDYWRIGPFSKLKLNPFDLEGQAHTSKPTPVKLSFLEALIALISNADLGKMQSSGERQIVRKALKASYEEAALTGKTPNLFDFAIQLKRKAYQVDDTTTRRRLHAIWRAVRKFSNANDLGALLQGQTNITERKVAIIFDTSSLKDHRSQAIANLVLAEFIKRNSQDTANRNDQYTCAFTEVWPLIRLEGGRQELARMTASSQLTLLIGTTSADIPKSGLKWLANQIDAHIQLPSKNARQTTAVGKQKMTELELEILEKNLGQPRVLLVTQEARGTLSLVASGLEYWIVTAEPKLDVPRRRKKILELKKENPTLNFTDRCRQAVYFLGLEHPDLT